MHILDNCTHFSDSHFKLQSSASTLQRDINRIILSCSAYPRHSRVISLQHAGVNSPPPAPHPSRCIAAYRRKVSVFYACIRVQYMMFYNSAGKTHIFCILIYRGKNFKYKKQHSSDGIKCSLLWFANICNLIWFIFLCVDIYLEIQWWNRLYENIWN